MATDIRDTLTRILVNGDVSEFKMLLEKAVNKNCAGRLLVCVGSLMTEVSTSQEFTSAFSEEVESNPRCILVSAAENRALRELPGAEEIIEKAAKSEGNWGSFDVLYNLMTLDSCGVMTKGVQNYAIDLVNFLTKNGMGANILPAIKHILEFNVRFFEIKILNKDLLVDEEATWRNRVSLINLRKNLATGINDDEVRALAFSSIPYTYADFVECHRQGLITSEQLEYMKGVFTPLIFLVEVADKTQAVPIFRIQLELLRGPLTRMLHEQ